ncbi:hypothetical protein [Paraburkholderia steynii]|uniref:hypothetical protein n=1 Tax=Paraburkholderia steynii TaxID=1245441 RepID=UPI00115FAB71|nr:hypothetical protein [Paraburkholderia steynii]
MKPRWSLLALPHWNGINAFIAFACMAIGIAGILITLRTSNPENTTGTLRVQRWSASSIIPPEFIPNGDTSLIDLKAGGQRIAPGHLQLRVYIIGNQTGRHITPQDFDSPITLHAISGYKILDVETKVPGNRPPIVVTRTGLSTAVIAPTLINAGESFSIKLLMATPKPAPLIEDPFVGDEGVIQWTAAIRGVDLAVTGFDRPQTQWLDEYAAGFFLMHKANATLAMVAIAFLLSWAQMVRIKLSTPVIRLTYFSTFEIAVRLGFAWAAAESLVSFDDTLLATKVWQNWACIAAYVALLLIPPRKSQDAEGRTENAPQSAA